ncbi:MAG: 50S ribosomal protein L5 [Clostridia bacterium]|nr:50S ribosomal protein L5 [Clostridia bacterium]
MAKKNEASQAPAKKKSQAQAKAFSGPARLRVKYREEVVPALMEQFHYANIMQVPKLEKIVINMGLGAEKDNPKGMDSALEELSIISGQKAIITRAKKSVANFKVRQGMNVGAKVTLRGDRMYHFADKLMNIVLPRVRDFRGVSASSFDGRGNYAMGVREQLIFPEINYDDVDKVRGMDIAFVTTAETDEEAKALLKLLGMPFAE